MKKSVARPAALARWCFWPFAPSTQAQTKQLTLCWAAWDPANALVELSKDFHGQVGHPGMKFESSLDQLRGPHSSIELNSKGKLCEHAHPRQPVDRGARERALRQAQRVLREERIKMSDFMPAHGHRLIRVAEEHANYWAPAGDGGRGRWTYRKDWFARPEIKAEFKEEVQPRARSAQDYDQLKEIAQFFQGRTIDGKKVYGAYIYNRARVRRHHHGRHQRAL